jgi:hypothetical protein
MSAVAFDTLKLARKLRDSAHMPQEQAEGIADALTIALAVAAVVGYATIRDATRRAAEEMARQTSSTIAKETATSVAARESRAALEQASGREPAPNENIAEVFSRDDTR